MVDPHDVAEMAVCVQDVMEGEPQLGEVPLDEDGQLQEQVLEQVLVVVVGHHLF